jgi:hypothetical protein
MVPTLSSLWTATALDTEVVATKTSLAATVTAGAWSFSGSQHALDGLAYFRVPVAHFHDPENRLFG